MQLEKRGVTAVINEFYRHAARWEDEDRLVGILPERRTDPQRITHQSIMNWAKLLVPEIDVIENRVYFNQIDIA